MKRIDSHPSFAGFAMLVFAAGCSGQGEDDSAAWQQSLAAFQQDFDDLSARVDAVEGRAGMPGFQGRAGDEGSMGPAGPRGPEGPAGPPGDPNALVKAAEAISDGCFLPQSSTDDQLQMPQCGPCSTQSCSSIGAITGAPAAAAGASSAWMWAGTFTVLGEGAVQVDVGRSLVCDRKDELAGKPIAIDLSMQMASTLNGRGPDPAYAVQIGHSLALRPTADRGAFAFAESGPLSGRLDTRLEGDAIPGSVWAILVSLAPGQASAGCHFVEAPVELRFTPAPTPTMDISH